MNLATDKAAGERPSPVDVAVSSVSPWSEAERSPALLEVQWKAMTQEEAGWRMEEGSPGQVEGASDLQAFVWSPSDGGHLCEPAETLATADLAYWLRWQRELEMNLA